MSRPFIKIFTSKNLIFHHACVIIKQPYEKTLYADDIKSITCKSDIIVTFHGFTRNHVLNRVEKYLRKHNLIDLEDMDE